MIRVPTWSECVLSIAALWLLFAWCDRGTAITRLQTAIDAKAKPVASAWAFPVSSGSNEFAFKLALLNETAFEHAHGLQPRFDECRPAADDTMSCSTLTDAGIPVVYHCNHEGCAIDCGATK